MFERGHFIYTATQSPYVRFLVIWLVCKEFWTHIIRCTNDGVSQVTGTLQHTGYAQVTNLHNTTSHIHNTHTHHIYINTTLHTPYIYKYHITHTTSPIHINTTSHIQDTTSIYTTSHLHITHTTHHIHHTTSHTSHTHHNITHTTHHHTQRERHKRSILLAYTVHVCTYKVKINIIHSDEHLVSYMFINSLYTHL